jgi:hypothetical protein
MLVIAEVIGIFLTSAFPYNTKVEKVVMLVDFNQEANIPAFFSSLILLLSSILLFAIHIFKKNTNEKHLPWLILAAIFCFLALDEAVAIHELMMGPVRDNLNTSGIFHYAWVIPYGLALLVFLVLYVPFLVSLPRTTMILFVISGFIFVLGALGFEMLGGRHIQMYGHDMTYSFYYTLEETLEMVGISLFIFTLLRYISLEHGAVSLLFKHESQTKELIKKSN